MPATAREYSRFIRRTSANSASGESMTPEAIFWRGRISEGGEKPLIQPGCCRARHAIRTAYVAVALLHRPAGLCLGHRHRHHVGGSNFGFQPAGGAISHHCAAGRGGECDLSRCRRRHFTEFRDPGDRAAAHGPGQSSLLRLHVQRRRHRGDHRHFRAGNGPRHRPGAGSEQGAAGGGAIARPGAAIGCDGRQGPGELPALGWHV